jgi:hypothetical protein
MSLKSVQSCWILLLALVIKSSGFPVDLHNPPLCNFTKPANATIGTSIPLCIFVMSAPSGDATAPTTYVAPQIKSMAFSVPVDEYAMLDFSGSFEKLTRPARDQDKLFTWATGAASVTAWPRECALDPGVPNTFPPVDSTSAPRSCPQLYMTRDHVVPLASLVAIMNNGVLENLVWDNECQTCPTLSDSCIAGRLALTLVNATSSQQYLAENIRSKITDNSICSVTFDQCLPTNKTGINCDLRVLLTWQGTDANGKRLTSSSLRLTQFSGSSVGSMWDSVANSFNPTEEVNANNSITVR